MLHPASLCLNWILITLAIYATMSPSSALLDGTVPDGALPAGVMPAAAVPTIVVPAVVMPAVVVSAVVRVPPVQLAVPVALLGLGTSSG